MSTQTPRTEAASFYPHEYANELERLKTHGMNTESIKRDLNVLHGLSAEAFLGKLQEFTTERDQLRSDCENETKWAAHYLAQSIAEKARAERAEAEVKRLRSDRDCEKRLRKDADEFRENAIARAARAEDNLAALEQSFDDNCRGVVKIADDLAVERARLDWLMAGGMCLVQHSGGFHVCRLHCQVSRAAIDLGMKEDAK